MAQISNQADLLAPQDSSTPWTQNQIDQYNKRLNVLHQFRSYSYHHVLLVANTTTITDAIFSNADFNSSLDSYLHPSQQDKYAAKSLADFGDQGGKYIILINGMTDAQYLIDAIEWEAIFQPDAGVSNPHSSFVEGTMEIIEPRGVSFLNLLRQACDTLQTDPSGLVFAIKTFFVGWTDDISQPGSQAQVQQIINVNPMTVVIQDIQAEFTNTGSSYTLSFVGQVNGVSRMPEFGVVQNSGIAPSGTIGSAIKNLQTALNLQTKKAHDTLVTQLDESNKSAASTSNTPTEKFVGRLVSYNFVVDSMFADLPLDNVNPKNATSSSDSNAPPAQGVDIDSALTEIMLQSSGVVGKVNTNLTSGYKNVFKIESVIEMTLTDVVITYNIKPCKLPTIVNDNRSNSGTIIKPQIYDRPVITFEYLYTGKNIEVLEYDMKMMYGLAFFQQYQTSNVVPSAFAAGAGNVTTLSSGPGSVMRVDSTTMRPITPVTNGAQVKDASANNKPAAGDTANFRMAMARWAFTETVSTTIKVAGIPLLLDGFNLLGKDVSTQDGTAQSGSLPLVKIHIEYPNDPSTVATNGQYASDFWYDGSYLILSVKNTFRDGRFEQTLDLIAMPYEEMINPTTDGAATGTATSPTSSTTVSNTPVASKGTGTTAQTTTPAITPEQKAKHDTAAPSVAPDVKYNCDSILSVKYTTLADCQSVQLTTDWTLADFIRRQINVTNDAKILTNLCKVATQLELLQAWIGAKITITSAYRSPAFNNSVKGASATSDHMKGLAVDCQFAGIRPQDAWNKLKSSPFKFRQCIWEHFGSSSWVHCAFDVDPSIPVQNTARFFTLPH